MYPKFNNGDILLIENVPVEKGEIGVFNLNNEGFVKIFRGSYLESVNKEYENIEFKSADDIHVVGKVVGVLNEEDIVEYVDRAEFSWLT